MKTHRKTKWILLALAAVILISLPFCFLYGNPVSHILVRARANSYLNSTYPELDLNLKQVIYDFKHGGWYVHVASPASIDTHFDLMCDGFGHVQYDRYENDVLSGGTTFARHEAQYQSLVEEAFRHPDSPFAPDDVYGELCNPGKIEYFTRTTEQGTEFYTIEKDFSLDLSTLELDQNYDVPALGAVHGQLTVFVQDEDVSLQRAAELLLELRSFLDEQGVPFYAVEFWLSPISREGVIAADGDTICLWDFLYSDIYEDGLTARVESAHQEYQNHLAIQNTQ